MISGRVNYLAESVQPSLRRNGRVFTRRDSDGSDSGSEGVVVEACDVEISDARSVRLTSDLNGFELCADSLHAPMDFYDHDAVIGSYYGACEELVQNGSAAYDAWLAASTGG